MCSGRKEGTSKSSRYCRAIPELISHLQVTPAQWQSYTHSCAPDIITALADTPFTPPPHSQKRLTKSIERSAEWLGDLLKFQHSSSASHRPSVLVSMAGGISVQARKAFANALLEPLSGPSFSATPSSLPNLDAGVSGYVFDLAPLSASLPPSPSSSTTQSLVELLRASLEPLPRDKLRIANTPRSPHQILSLVLHAGIDAFDAHFAVEAATIGIAFDFRFPVPSSGSELGSGVVREAKRDWGLNLFDDRYEKDFDSLSSALLPATQVTEEGKSEQGICLCAACSPVQEPVWQSHSKIDPSPSSHNSEKKVCGKPYTRAYIHHLLRTHEMSALALLTAHNLSTLQIFFSGIRSCLQSHPENFEDEVKRFTQVYGDEEGEVLVGEARKMWSGVERDRGKGRIAREREKEKEKVEEERKVLDTGVEGAPAVDLGLE